MEYSVFLALKIAFSAVAFPLKYVHRALIDSVGVDVIYVK